MSVTFEVSKNAIVFASGESESLHKPCGHGYSGNGSMKLSMVDQFFLLGLYDKDLGRTLYNYVAELFKFLGPKVYTSSICKLFKYLFDFKGSS